MEPRKPNHEGLRLKEFRISKGISQKEMAEKLSCSQPNLSKIERGELGISSSLRDIIMNEFPDINLLWLFTGSGEIENLAYDSDFVKENFLDGKSPKGAHEYFEKFRLLVEQGKVPNQVIATIFKDMVELYKLQYQMFETIKKSHDVLLRSVEANTKLMEQAMKK